MLSTHEYMVEIVVELPARNAKASSYASTIIFRFLSRMFYVIYNPRYASICVFSFSNHRNDLFVRTVEYFDVFFVSVVSVACSMPY